jgi:hypothetical protein
MISTSDGNSFRAVKQKGLFSEDHKEIISIQNADELYSVGSGESRRVSQSISALSTKSVSVSDDDHQDRSQLFDSTHALL